MKPPQTSVNLALHSTEVSTDIEECFDYGSGVCMALLLVSFE